MIHEIRCFWQSLIRSDLRHYFSKNGHGVIEGKKFRGWRELPNGVSSKTAIWSAIIIGGPRGNGFFATWCYSDGLEKGPQELIDKVELASRMLDLYADPRKCRLHGSWRG